MSYYTNNSNFTVTAPQDKELARNLNYPKKSLVERRGFFGITSCYGFDRQSDGFYHYSGDVRVSNDPNLAKSIKNPRLVGVTRRFFDLYDLHSLWVKNEVVLYLFVHDPEEKFYVSVDLKTLIEIYGAEFKNLDLIIAGESIFKFQSESDFVELVKDQFASFGTSNLFWRNIAPSLIPLLPTTATGGKKLIQQLQPHLERMLSEGKNEEALRLFWALQSYNTSSSKVRIGTVLTETLSGQDYDSIVKTMEDAFTVAEDDDFDRKVYNLAWVEKLPAFKMKRKEVIKKDTSKAIGLMVQELDSIALDENSYPKTYEALVNGEIPISLIIPDKESYFQINNTWELWEEMLTKFPETTIKIAKAAASRRLYEKDLMSYFYVILRDMPAYLKKHTGDDWQCAPTLVDTEEALNPPVIEEGRRTTKTRSALTPVADNETKIVTIPYASLRISGYATQYCYSHSYHILKEGFTLEGQVVMRDLETKLNGRDDYGLMFYTLTGTHTARGYPTFLIIFERMPSKGKTRVHFHRTHPMRSKDGDTNPVSNWTRTSYGWMIGNVNAKDILFQQGDLAFIRPSKPLDFQTEGLTRVSDCDSHAFAKAVLFQPYTGKDKNILGHVLIEGQNVLNHPEHENVAINNYEGWLEVRQARTWEANPKGIWTINID
jgi:hypothetical protein